MAYKKFTRSSTDRKIAGVCGGIGRFLNIDPTLLRIFFLMLLLFGGSGLLLYIIIWVMTPEA